MVEGPVKIVMAIKEPENRHILWMRPYLDKEGYELLYYGSRGWTRWLPCCPVDTPIKEDHNGATDGPSSGTLEGIDCTTMKDRPGTTTNGESPCGCSN